MEVKNPQRPGILDKDPARIPLLAEMIADGVKNADIAATFGVHKDTISEWKKRADVQQLVTTMMQRRANSILSQTDTAIQKKLEEARDSGKSLPIELLLKVRQTFAGERITVDTTGDRAGAVGEALLAMSENPELAAAFGLVTKSIEDDDGDD